MAEQYTVPFMFVIVLFGVPMIITWMAFTLPFKNPHQTKKPLWPDKHQSKWEAGMGPLPPSKIAEQEGRDDG